ncbi:MAG: hypothetical protein IKC65_04545 [Lentisphaeria bacterium]|nr:hypothetical protein [Lentisphaeria bacterium]
MKKYIFAVLFAGCAVFFAGCGETTPEQAMSRAVVLAGKGEWEKADEIAEQTGSRYPDIAAVHILRAVTAERCGSRDRALDAARRAVELDPGSFEAQYTLGRLYAADTARSSEAEQALLKAFKMRKNDVNVKILLCNVAMGANSPRTTGYLGLLKSSPELAASAAFNNQYAVNYVRRGNYRAAKEYFVKAFQAGREEPEIVLNVARFYDGCLGDRITAVKLYREYLRIAGKDADGKAEAEARLARLARRR